MKKLVDMELDDDQKTDFCAPIACDRPDYPYGLRVSLDQNSLAKLGLSASDFKTRQMIDMRCFGVVTAVTQEDNESGEHGRVEIQIQKMGLENEDEEGLGGEAGDRALPKGLILYAMRKHA